MPVKDSPLSFGFPTCTCLRLGHLSRTEIARGVKCLNASSFLEVTVSLLFRTFFLRTLLNQFANYCILNPLRNNVLLRPCNMPAKYGRLVVCDPSDMTQALARSVLSASCSSKDCSLSDSDISYGHTPTSRSLGRQKGPTYPAPDLRIAKKYKY